MTSIQVESGFPLNPARLLFLIGLAAAVSAAVGTAVRLRKRRLQRRKER